MFRSQLKKEVCVRGIVMELPFSLAGKRESEQRKRALLTKWLSLTLPALDGLLAQGMNERMRFKPKIHFLLEIKNKNKNKPLLICSKLVTDLTKKLISKSIIQFNYIYLRPPLWPALC